MNKYETETFILQFDIFNLKFDKKELKYAQHKGKIVNNNIDTCDEQTLELCTNKKFGR